MTSQSRANRGASRSHRTFLVVLVVLLLSFSVASPSPVFAQSPAIDSAVTCSGSATTSPVSCEAGAGGGTTGANDLMIIQVAVVGSSPTISTPQCTPVGGGGSGCPSSISSRTSITDSSTPKTEVAEYYGVVTSSSIKHVTISAVFTGSVAYIVVVAFSGQSNSPFPVSAVTNQGASASPSVTLTSSTTDITLIGLEADQSATAESAGSGFTIASSVSTSSPAGSAAFEYQSFTSGCPSGCTIGFGSSTTNWVLIGDAIQSTASVPDLPYGFVLVALPVLMAYLLARRRRPDATRSPEALQVPSRAETGWRPPLRDSTGGVL